MWIWQRISFQLLSDQLKDMQSMYSEEGEEIISRLRYRQCSEEDKELLTILLHWMFNIFGIRLRDSPTPKFSLSTCVWQSQVHALKVSENKRNLSEPISHNDSWGWRAEVLNSVQIRNILF